MYYTAYVKRKRLSRENLSKYITTSST